MYTLVRRYIKTAVGFLATGLLLGLWMLVRRELWQRFPTPYETSAHTHALLVGFVMMMILGVALWLFPRPDKADARYRPLLAELAYWMLATGTAGRVVGELSRAAVPERWMGWVIILCGTLQLGGIGVFFHTMWGRIRPVGSAQREARGERF
jgi:heme/copper-type cytochrome/quinol oxidase subunit 1